MKVLLFGNIATGKTTIANTIVNDNPFLEYLSIDDFRRKFSKGTIITEVAAVERFTSSIKKTKPQLIEATGFGEVGNNIYSKLKETSENILLVILTQDLKTIHKRLAKRITDVPYPDEFDALTLTVENINKKILTGDLFTRWGNLENVSVFKSNDTDLIIRVINEFIN
jgi:deoxyadenosine/deoxycytidine kinase